MYTYIHTQHYAKPIRAEIWTWEKPEKMRMSRYLDSSPEGRLQQDDSNILQGPHKGVNISSRMEDGMEYR